ncbi:MAG TPA: sigma-70 family RNA polymerase sigma factor [Acidimicrobiales bacterium]|nr:sigma-70 family RNA polymerase sigma factor [Acidimicrobiales bacterium]
MEKPDNPPGAEDPAFAAIWNAHRRRMLDLSFRILLDVGDAEDVVQEAFTRLARADLGGIEDPEGWLVVVTSRLCLDKLRGRRRHPTDALDPGRDPFDPGVLEPSDYVTLGDSVTLAMHAVLERLSPAERTSFVLHDVFQYSFDEVATIVGRTPGACRQLASRARRTLRAQSSAGRFPVDDALQRRISERFIEACAGGDLEGLLALLDPAVDGAGDVVPEVVAGAENVAPGILRYLGPPASPTLLHLPVGDRIGIVAVENRRVLALVLLTVDNGLVVHVDALAGAGPRAAVGAALGLS